MAYRIELWEYSGRVDSVRVFVVVKVEVRVRGYRMVGLGLSGLLYILIDAGSGEVT